MADENLETRKLRAEIAKLEAETEVALRHRWSWLSDLLKVAGAVIATTLGIYAAITTYRITELETELAAKKRSEVQQELKEALTARDAAVLARTTAERELSALESKLQTAQRDISAALGQSPSASVAASLDKVSGNLAAASDRVQRFLPYVLIVPATDAQKEATITYSTRLKLAEVRSSIFMPLRDPRRAPSTLLVRFFQPQDRAEADRILKLAIGDSNTLGRVEYLKEPTITRYRYYELRLPVNFSN